MGARVVFTGKQQVVLEAHPVQEPGPGMVRLRTRCSLMSTGTENICFNRLFEPGSHWDKWVRYPFFPGYSTIGIVEAVGSGCEGIAIGQRVACRAPHSSHPLVEASRCCPVPEGIDDRSAAWFALSKIARVGSLAADYRLGDQVLVIGAGPIGQMTVRWAVAAGAKVVIVVDSVEMRLGLARAGGATHAIAATADACADAVKAACGGVLPRVVVDTTGNEHVFPHALALARTRGTVVILGDTGSPSLQRLTPDVITRGLSIVGAHDLLEEDRPHVALFYALATTGRFALSGLNTDVFKPDQCAAAYAAANTRRGETMGIIFDWA